MNHTLQLTAQRSVPAPARKLSRDTVSMTGDLLPLFDFVGVLLAAWLASLLFASGLASSTPAAAIWNDGMRAALAAALLAPLILCDRAFVVFASGGQTAALIRCYAVRFLMFAGVVAAIGIASRSMDRLPGTWLALWFASSLLVTALVRGLLVANLRRLEQQGVLTETVAVVGAGALAERLILELRQRRGGHVEVLGPFEDRSHGDDAPQSATQGSIADLLQLGKSRALDWIVLATADASEGSTQALVHRLKALSAPIGRCPQTLEGSGLLSDIPVGTGRSWSTTRAAMANVLPPWIVTLLGLPLAALRALRQAPPTPRAAPLKLTLDDYDLERFAAVAAQYGARDYGYVVTPNADHLIRLHRDAAFRALYADAAYVLLDSRFIAHLLRYTQQLRLPVCTGSDLTAKLFDEVIAPEDRIVLIGGNDRQAQFLTARYGLRRLAHFNPPMGFVHDAQALEDCLRFVENHSPFRYCLLAVGAPQQEHVARQLQARGIARGLALCIGASINFMTGDERRAPKWMQRGGLEWLYRLLQAPSRMAQRYLVRGPQLFGLLRRTQVQLRAAPPASVPASMPAPAAALSGGFERIELPLPQRRRLMPRTTRQLAHRAAWRATMGRDTAGRDSASAP